MAKQILYDIAGRRKIQMGIHRLARAVKVTLGPSGRNVILSKSFGGPSVTRDGVSVAKEVELSDPFENLGARLVCEVSTKTSTVAGDGTSTATVLAEAIYDEGLKALTSGINPLHLKRGLEKAADAAVEALKRLARPVKGRTEIVQVATISANHDAEIGNLLADAMEKAGKDGVITVEEGKSRETTLEVVDGLRFDKGYVSPYFVNNPQTLSVHLENTWVLILEKKLSSIHDVIPVLEQVLATGRPLLIIAEDIEGEALAALIVNRLRGQLACCAVKSPGFGDRRKQMLGDLAVLTGGTFFSDDLGRKLDSASLADLGQAEKVIVDKDTTTVIGGKGAEQAVRDRIRQIQVQIEQATSDYDREKMEERLGKLSGGVAIVQVGGATETEMKERKARVEDALHATRAAAEEGVVPGGGVALLRARRAVEKLKLPEDEAIGAQILLTVLSAPIRQIAKNTGADGDLVAQEVMELSGSMGYDAIAGEICDMVERGILDPLKVTRTALQNAVSVASLMLTTETMVTDIKTGTRKGEGVVR